ncbi:hypothetical protein [Streptomyces sp. FH025]|uniref:hypothetical protein n=1 Tax=Streptomyces sp. FH025 TaxID=2815937 RepID=UPI001A9F8E65|nr:hypothetical protein [Streptomyces sp. FH025]MBO1414679.1 hypothetical protein [Streptomyces sp. FH025]
MDVPLSPWMTELFGEQALAVRTGLGQALRNMQANAQAGQEQADVRTKHPFGSARWSGQFERVYEELRELPGAKPVKPYRFPFDLVLVGRGLIYPFLYARTRSDILTARVPSNSGMVRELFTFAPAPTAPTSIQGAFDFEFATPPEEPAVELHGGLTTVPPDTCLVLVPFACNSSELLEAHWGVAAHGADGVLDWVAGPEALPLPEAVTFHGKRLSSVPTQSGPAILEHTGFDQGETPTLTLSSRSNVDRTLNVTPLTEAEPAKPQINENDATN